MSNRIILILCFVLCCSSSLQAQDNNAYSQDTVGARVIQAPIEEINDSDYYEEIKEAPVDTNLFARYINLPDDSIRNWKNRKEYAYTKNLDSLLKASQEVQQVPQTRAPRSGSFMNQLLGGSIIKIILWTLAILFVGIIVYQLLKRNGLFQSSYKSKVAEKPAEEEELSLQNDFDPLIDQAFKQGDYRMAVRYHFLKTLQQLRDKNQINYEPDKTNSRYVYEIPVNWRNDFSQLILQYEYVWYGHFDINREQYEQVQKRFHSFLQKV